MAKQRVLQVQTKYRERRADKLHSRRVAKRGGGQKSKFCNGEKKNGYTYSQRKGRSAARKNNRFSKHRSGGTKGSSHISSKNFQKGRGRRIDV